MEEASDAAALGPTAWSNRLIKKVWRRPHGPVTIQRWCHVWAAGWITPEAAQELATVIMVPIDLGPPKGEPSAVLTHACNT